MRPEHAEAFARIVGDVPWAWIGEVTTAAALEIVTTTGGAERVSLDRLDRAWRGEEA